MKVCSKSCSIDMDASNMDQLACQVPPIASKRSNELFKLIDEGNMYGSTTIYSGMGEYEAQTVYD